MTTATAPREPGDTTHACPIPGCRARVPRAQLLCYTHWKMVPKDIGKRVYNTYARSPLSAEHEQAMQEALEAVNRRIAGG